MDNIGSGYRMSDYVDTYEWQGEKKCIFLTFTFEIRDQDWNLIEEFVYDDEHRDSSPIYEAEILLVNRVTSMRLSDKLFIDDVLDGYGEGSPFFKTESFDVTISDSITDDEFFDCFGPLHDRLQKYRSMFVYRNRAYHVKSTGVFLTPKKDAENYQPRERDRVRQDGVHCW
jgi:hypothetical protein